MVQKGVILALAFLFRAASFLPAQAADDFDLVQNRSGGITITGYRGAEKNVVIPERIQGLAVTVIGTKAFYRKDLESALIPQTVHTIEPLAFSENRLTSAALPGSVFIGYEAFAGNSLAALELPEKLHSIGQRAFINNRLESVSIPAHVTNIGKDAFAGNPLCSVTLAEQLNIFTSQGFEPSLVNYYTGNGRKAGVYVKEGRVWVLEEASQEGESYQDSR